VDPRAGLDAGARGKSVCPCWGSNPGRPVRSQALYLPSCRGLTYDKTEIMVIFTTKMIGDAEKRSFLVRARF
jgi:hypothetical protein